MSAAEEWIEDFALNVDIFMYSYCGYWLQGMRRVPGKGWLARDIFESSFEDEDVAVEAWLKGCPLPKGWYGLDRAFAEKALFEGQKKYGSDFAEEYDAEMADVAVQRALLGKVKYG